MTNQTTATNPDAATQSGVHSLGLPADPTPAPVPRTDGAGVKVQLNRIIEAIWVGTAMTTDNVRFGLFDTDGQTITASKRVWAQEWIDHEMGRLFFDTLTAISRLPDNAIRVTVYLGTEKIMDSAFAFANAKVI